MKIKLSKERKVLRIETDEFSIILNGKSNQQYKDILAPLGITLEFEEENPSAVSVNLLDKRASTGDTNAPV